MTCWSSVPPSCRSGRTRPRRCSRGRASRSRRPRRPSCWSAPRAGRSPCPSPAWPCARAGPTSTRHSDLGFTGDDVFMREYLRTEVLGGLRARDTDAPGALLDPRRAVRPAVRRGAADPVLGRGAGAPRRARGHRTGRPQRRPLPVPPPPARPAAAPSCTARNPRWCRSCTGARPAGTRTPPCPDQAIEHAHRAGDVAQFTQLVLDWSQQTWAAGGIDSVHRWMSWLEEARRRPRVPGDRRARGADLRAGRRARPRGQVVRDREGGTRVGHAARRQHGRGDARLPGRDRGPPGHGADAARRAARLDRAVARSARCARRCCTPRRSRTCSTATSTAPTTCSSRLRRPPS